MKELHLYDKLNFVEEPVVSHGPREEGHMSDFEDNLDGDQNIDDYDVERLNITWEGYRRTRLEQYINYENIPLSGEAVVKEYNTKVRKVGATMSSSIYLRQAYMMKLLLYTSFL
nr:hypothetical protein [Tanacetum cinerariifolium]